MNQHKTIVDVYNYLLCKCVDDGYRQDIQRGSFENEEHTHRMQSRPLMLEIQEPVNFLLLPKEITPGTIQEYYDTLILSDEIHENHEYTYGQRIVPQIYDVFGILRETPNTNQARIVVARAGDSILKDPPCLSELLFSYFDNKLHLTSIWRSNDIGNAFLMNQGGLGLLLQDAANYAGLEMGSHFYCSTGAHVYVRG